ncbi:hypothetical protein HMPREF0731_3678, partial [Pseudoroseomonas cervicalis ATCC 49957]
MAGSREGSAPGRLPSSQARACHDDAPVRSRGGEPPRGRDRHPPGHHPARPAAGRRR